MHMHMHNDDDRRPTLAQREMWLFQAITVACAVSAAVIGMCVVTMTLGWRPELMPILAVMATVAWAGAIALAVTLATAKMVGELRDEINADERQRRKDEIHAELVDDDDASAHDDVSVHRLRR